MELHMEGYIYIRKKKNQPSQSNHLRGIVLEQPAQTYGPTIPIPKQLFQNYYLNAIVSELPSPVLELLS